MLKCGQSRGWPTRRHVPGIKGLRYRARLSTVSAWHTSTIRKLRRHASLSRASERGSV
jgi:hypothetical protein